MTPPVLRLGLIGHGTVGQSFTRHFADFSARLEVRLGARIRLTHLAVRHPDRLRRLPGELQLVDAPTLARDPSIDVVVEASGDARADEWLLAALDRGAAVVTANKQAVARSTRLLRALADRHPRFGCEAAVAAAVPIVRTLRDSLQGEEIRAIRGILNGTSTAVLSTVEGDATWEDAISAAQDAGLAERGSNADFDGSDAAAKLAILSTIAWRVPTLARTVHLRGLDARHARLARDARREGRRLRLVAEAWTATTAAGVDRAPVRHLVVEPRVLDADDPLATAHGAANAIELHAALAGCLRWFGPGAGGDHTASALLADVATLSRELIHPRGAQVAA